MNTRRKLIVVVIFALALVYIGTYVALSSTGQFVPVEWGLGWVKHYAWAPRGFVVGPFGTEQRRVLQSIFLPIWLVDMRLIHTSEKASGNFYPVNTNLDAILQKQLKLWEQNHQTR